MTKFVLPISSQTMDKRVEGGREKLQTILETYIVNLKAEKFL